MGTGWISAAGASVDRNEGSMRAASGAQVLALAAMLLTRAFSFETKTPFRSSRKGGSHVNSLKPTTTSNSVQPFHAINDAQPNPRHLQRASAFFVAV